MPKDPKQLEKKLAEAIVPRQKLLTAYSGGVDSTLVAAVARRVLGREAAPAVIGDSLSLPRRELDEARQIAEQLDLNLITVQPGEQDDPNYQANAGDRCYHCKSHLYEALWTLADDLGITHLANGTNADDLGDHRRVSMLPAKHAWSARCSKRGWAKPTCAPWRFIWGCPTRTSPPPPASPAASLTGPR